MSHQAKRGDEVEAWLKRQRDGYTRNSSPWLAADFLLDDYRLHADTGEPLCDDVRITEER